ncbi:MAG: hypothetical protein HY402_06675, partial [Elusimicrobia bacterium]|nr:hypothetical protein [Elusimicrobiota bacterium]
GLALDSRDPVIFDPELTVLRLRSRQTGKTVAILGNWACHPEVLGRENRELTADYPGAWCRVMEERHGGTAIFFSGAIGGLLTPDRDFSRDGFAEAERIGKKLAQESLEALKQAGPYRGASRVDFRVQELSVPIENSRYLLALPLLARYRPIYRPDGRRFSWFGKYWFWIRHRWLGAVEARRLPRVRSEVAWARVGPAEFLFVPGELFPELAVGGFDGRLRFGYPLLSPLNPNPPDLAQAPGGPYLKSLFRREYRFLIGLANDELGYIVPRYDFKINPDSPTLSPRPPGHHYEETNSIGPSATDLILEAAQNLLRAIP